MVIYDKYICLSVVEKIANYSLNGSELTKTLAKLERDCIYGLHKGYILQMMQVFRKLNCRSDTHTHTHTHTQREIDLVGRVCYK